jgi:enoyl-CoA hydratase/carnithine racemase
MSQSKLAEYQNLYELARVERDGDGVLEITLHTRCGPLEQGRESNIEWAQMFDDVRRDPDNRVVILTRAGDAFTPPQPVPGGPGRTQPAAAWHRVWREGMTTIQSVMEIPVPVIAAINGPVHRHPELPLMSDIVLATPDAVFQDECHLPQGLLPGDGMHVVMPMLMGRVRGSYFLLTGQVLDAEDARAMGLVNEIVERDR